MASRNKPRRVRRCLTAVPGVGEKMLTKAAGLSVAHVRGDLKGALASRYSVPRCRAHGAVMLPPRTVAVQGTYRF